MKDKIFYFLLIILCFGVYITGLFPDVSIDAGKYAAVSRYMYESGDMIHLKVHGEPYMQKPLLFFWLTSLSFSVFGLSMFAFKLPSLLFSILGVYSTYRLAGIYYGKSVAKIAAVVFATSQMLFLYNNDLHTDALLTATMITGLWQLAVYLQTKKLMHLIFGFFWIGLAVITKGPIGIAIPVFALGGHLLIKREWSQLFSPYWLIGLPILAIILFPTLKGVYDQFGWEGIRFFFLTNNIGRITGEYSGTNADYFYYLHTIIYIFLPWSFYTFMAFYFNGKNLFHNNRHHRIRAEYLTYSGIILYVSILSVSMQKAPHYLFPLIPLFSIIVADFIHKVSCLKSLNVYYKWMKGFRMVVVILVLLLTIFIPVAIFPTTKLYIWLPLGSIFALLIYTFSRNKTRKEHLILPLVICSIGLNFIINVHFIPSAFKYQGVINASYRFNELASDEDLLYTYKYREFETYYYPKNISIRVDDMNQMEPILEQSGIWIITTQDGYNDILEKSGMRISFEQVFGHQRISQMNYSFLNPALREKNLKKIYLLKLN